MGNVKTKHRGGFTAEKPKTAPGGHAEQKPGNADKNHASKMSWKGQEHKK